MRVIERVFVRRNLVGLIMLLMLTGIAVAGCSSTEGVTGSNPAGTAIETDSILWFKDSNEALSRAQDGTKMIMINFYTDMCPACAMLDNNTFTDRDLIALLNENFVSLKINASKSSLSYVYGITAVPTTVFISPAGYGRNNEIARVTGYIPADSLSQGLQEILQYWQGIQATGE